MNILKEYVETVAQITDAPMAYVKATGYHLISSVLGKFIVCPLYPRPADNPMRPNIWIMLAGMPGITRKSTIINLEIHTLEQALLKYYSIKNPRASQDYNETTVRSMFIETGSPEGIADHISEMQDVVDTFILVSHEWGGILEQMKSKDYMMGLISLLSKLYNGEPHIWRGAKKTRYIKKGLYVTAVLGIQNPALYIQRRLYRQGLMRRILLVYTLPDDKDRWYPPLDLNREKHLAMLDYIAESLGDLAAKYDEYAPVMAHFMPEAREAVNNFAKEMEATVLSEGETNWALYSQSLWDHLTRLSIIHAASVKHPQESGGFGYVLRVDEVDVSEARRFIEMILPRMREAVAMSGTHVVERALVVDQGPLEAIYTIIKGAGSAGVNTTELLRRTRMLKDELKKYIINLMEEGKIIAVLERGRGRGRRAIKFYDAKYHVKAIQRGDEIGVKELNIIW